MPLVDQFLHQKLTVTVIFQPNRKCRNDGMWLFQAERMACGVQRTPLFPSRLHILLSAVTLRPRRQDLVTITSGTIASTYALAQLALLIDSTRSTDGEEEIAEAGLDWQKKAENRPAGEKPQPSAEHERPTPSSEGKTDIPRMWCASRMGRAAI